MEYSSERQSKPRSRDITESGHNNNNEERLTHVSNEQGNGLIELPMSSDTTEISEESSDAEDILELNMLTNPQTRRLIRRRSPITRTATTPRRSQRLRLRQNRKQTKGKSTVTSGKNIKLENDKAAVKPLEPPQAPTEADVPKCNVCLDTKPEIDRSQRKLLTTKCGHLFCSECFEKVLKSKRQCPMCSKKLTPKGYIQIFY